MGYYINPEDVSKEAWLAEHGAKVAGNWPPDPDHTLVCLVGSPMFTAAGIAYEQEERDQFAEPDGRPKTWYQVPTTDVVEVCPWAEKVLT